VGRSHTDHEAALDQTHPGGVTYFGNWSAFSERAMLSGHGGQRFKQMVSSFSNYA
jgi:hypothetical protein